MEKKKPDEYRTYGRGRSVRLPSQWYRAKGTFYFLTACCNEHRCYFGQDGVSDIVLRIWIEAAATTGVRLWGLCIMPDHLHVLVQLVEENRSVSDYIRIAKGRTYAALRGRADFAWQKKFNNHVLRDHEDPMKSLRYLLENPVRKGLTQEWQTWPWKYVDEEALL